MEGRLKYDLKIKRSEVFTTVNIQVMVFWSVAPFTVLVG